MLNDLNQPAKNWLADAMSNMGGLLADGQDPSFTLNVFGAEVEIRLNRLPGHFERASIGTLTVDATKQKCLRDPKFDFNMQGPCSAGRCRWPNCKPG